MGSRAYGSAAATRAAARMYQPGTNTAASHMQGLVTPTNRTAPGWAPTAPAGPEQPTVLPESHGSGCRQYTYDPELADLRSQGHRGSVMGDHAECGKRCCT